MEHMGLLFPTCMGWRQSATREGRAPATGGYHIIMIIIITTIIIIAIPKTVHREPNKQDKNYFPSQKVFLHANSTLFCHAVCPAPTVASQLPARLPLLHAHWG